MMWDVETSETRTAQKDYPCEAWPWIDNCGFAEEDLSEDDQGIIETARADGFKILKGQKYLHVRGMWEGEWTTYRARPELNDMCNRLDLFEY